MNKTDEEIFEIYEADYRARSEWWDHPKDVFEQEIEFFDRLPRLGRCDTIRRRVFVKLLEEYRRGEIEKDK